MDPSKIKVYIDPTANDGKPFGQRLQSGTVLVDQEPLYAPLATPPRHHGFTCPSCGSHMFGTTTWFPQMGDKYPPGTKVGQCHERQHSGNGCAFEWDRADAAQESSCIYFQSEEEWMASFVPPTQKATDVQKEP